MLSKDDIDVLKQFAREGGPVFVALRNLLQQEIENVASVKSIDLKGNVGLQTCARVYTHEALTRIFELFFQPKREERPKESYR